MGKYLTYPISENRQVFSTFIGVERFVSLSLCHNDHSSWSKATVISQFRKSNNSSFTSIKWKNEYIYSKFYLFTHAYLKVVVIKDKKWLI